MQLLNKIKLYTDLVRITKPAGFILLFWPCAWGLALGENDIDWFKMLLFFTGSIVMRSAGCIINDLADKQIDKEVKRTRNRPLASGRILVCEAIILLSSLLCVGVFILMQLNVLAIKLALAIMVLVILYPFAKRFTYFPQIILGLSFNSGVFIAYASVNNGLAAAAILLYLSGVFWTIGYDTIYGFQDISDDKKIGVKSTSVLFENKPRLFVMSAYSISFAFLLLSLYSETENFTTISLIFTIITFAHFFWQSNALKDKKFNKCASLFKSNMLVGGLIFLAIALN
ncbi:MAG: 4-hydroxybenzoate octaprenyltransferase [Rickettsiales bacterium]